MRPLKLGAKNWGAIGHPSAGPRLANLLTLVENCHQPEIDPEAYLINIIARLPDHPAKDIAALSPWRWKSASGPAVSTNSARRVFVRSRPLSRSCNSAAVSSTAVSPGWGHR